MNFYRLPLDQYFSIPEKRPSVELGRDFASSRPCMACSILFIKAPLKDVSARRRGALCVMNEAPRENTAKGPWPKAAIAHHNGTSPPHAGSYYVSRRPCPPFFEGWYLRVVLPNSQRSFAFMFSIESSGPGTIQLLDDKDRLHMLQLPPSQHLYFFGEKHRFSIAHWGYAASSNSLPGEVPASSSELESAVLQGYQLSSTSCHGRFIGSHGPVQWGFEYDPVLSWGERGAPSRCTATWLSRLPMFDPGYQVLMAHGVASGGYLRIGSEEVDVSGSAVYCEKNWGRGFPQRWWWVQANSFQDEPDLSITLLGATRKVFGIHEEIGIIAVHFQGLYYEFSNWNCDCLHWDVSVWGSWKASAKAMTGHTVEVLAKTSEGPVSVLGPSTNGMVYNVQDNARGTLMLTLRDEDGRAILEAVKCESAQVEIGGGPWEMDWNATVRKMPQPLRAVVNLLSRPKVRTSP